jgi:hypothetical protein
MVRKTLGYVELQWICPHCGNLNPGSNKFCNGCGAPMAEDVEFEQPAQEELLTDEAEIGRAKAGPDLHCPYCGSRNAGDAQFCGACGGGLEEALARTSGKVLGAHRATPAEDIVCPACGTTNAASSKYCIGCGASLAQAAKSRPEEEIGPASKARKRSPIGALLIGGVVFCLLVVAGFVLFGRQSEEIIGTVQRVEWTRSVPILAQQEVTDEDWRADIPAQAQISICQLEYHHTQDEPAANAEEVCGTPYTIDSGSGYGEVVQDCLYEVYEEWCTYTQTRWETVDTVTMTGSEWNPIWPEINLEAGQRTGEVEEHYEIVFQTDEGVYTYTEPDAMRFERFSHGSRWVLQINPFNQVVDVEPLR